MKNIKNEITFRLETCYNTIRNLRRYYVCVYVNILSVFMFLKLYKL